MNAVESRTIMREITVMQIVACLAWALISSLVVFMLYYSLVVKIYTFCLCVGFAIFTHHLGGLDKYVSASLTFAQAMFIGFGISRITGLCVLCRHLLALRAKNVHPERNQTD